MKKIIIDIDDFVWLEDGEQEIGLGDIGVDVVIEDRRSDIGLVSCDGFRFKHTHDTSLDGMNRDECLDKIARESKKVADNSHITE